MSSVNDHTVGKRATQSPAFATGRWWPFRSRSLRPLLDGIRLGIVSGALPVLMGCGRSEDGSAVRVTDSVDVISMGAALPTLDRERRYAVLVGIARYPDPAHALPGPPEDLRQMRELLVRRFGFRPENILTLSDAAATRDTIIWAFRHHLAQAGPGGSALFYFVGHGLALDRNYSVADSEPSGQDQALFVWSRGGQGALVLDDELNVLLRQLATPRAVMILDACYSGSGATFLAQHSLSRRDTIRTMSVAYAAPGDPAALPATFVSDGHRVTPGPALNAVLLAGAEDSRRAYSVSRWPPSSRGRSVFSHFLTNALSSAPAATTFERLTTDVANSAALWEPCVSRGYCQRPQIEGRLRAFTIGEVLGTP